MPENYVAQFKISYLQDSECKNVEVVWVQHSAVWVVLYPHSVCGDLKEIRIVNYTVEEFKIMILESIT